MPVPRYVWFLLASVSLTQVGCGSTKRPAEDANKVRLPRVETVLPRLEPILPIQIEVSAQVEAMEKAELCARVPGIVESLSLDDPEKAIDIGHKVRAGEPLLKLAVPELDADLSHKEALLDLAKNQLLQGQEARKVAGRELEEARALDQRFKAEFTQRKSKHDRTVDLVKRGVLQPEVEEETKSQMEAADSAWQAAKAQIETKQAKHAATEIDLKAADSRIKVAKAEVDRVKELVGYSIIKAPFDGVISRRLVDRGAMVKDPSIPLLTILRIDKVRVLLDIPERDVPKVNSTMQNPNPETGKGDRVELRLTSLQEAVKEGKFVGEVTRRADALDPNTRTMRAEVHLDNADGHLLHGMYGTAIVKLEERYNALTIPSTALIRRGSKAEIFLVEDATGDPPTGAARRIEVELGVDDGRRVQIRSGLSGKELIIARGAGVLRDGDRVIAIPMSEKEK